MAPKQTKKITAKKTKESTSPENLLSEQPMLASPKQYPPLASYQGSARKRSQGAIEQDLSSEEPSSASDSFKYQPPQIPVKRAKAAEKNSKQSAKRPGKQPKRASAPTPAPTVE
jgi:hypothetical protein